ncbi:MAG TPA: hypothetical protein VFV94_19470 [Polyangiaceae bacterium]|jgi:hypothetical protein|nr:hypothetical protein [Polyangiaceae bacterium]
MLREVAEQLDRWMIDENLRLADDGLLRLKPCTIRALGQAALLELGLPVELAATQDVDVRADYEDAVRRRFAELLRARGLELDPLGHEIWMPSETRYTSAFQGKFVALMLAEPEAILVSKALKAPAKNRVLIAEYLTVGPTPRFWQLAKKYRLDLEVFT